MVSVKMFIAALQCVLCFQETIVRSTLQTEGQTAQDEILFVDGLSGLEFSRAPPRCFPVGLTKESLLGSRNRIMGNKLFVNP